MAAAFCPCGFHTRQTSLDRCPDCAKSLFWQSLPLSVVQTKELAQLRVKAKRLTLETLYNQYCTELTSGTQLRKIWESQSQANQLMSIPLSALSFKLRQSLDIESVFWDFNSGCVIIYTNSEDQRVFINPGR